MIKMLTAPSRLCWDENLPVSVKHKLIFYRIIYFLFTFRKVYRVYQKLAKYLVEFSGYVTKHIFLSFLRLINLN